MSVKIEWDADFTVATMIIPAAGQGSHRVRFNPSELSELGVTVLEAERLGLLRRNETHQAKALALEQARKERDGFQTR